MVWDVIDHTQPQAPLDPAVLAHKAAVYAKRKADMAQMVRQAETPARPKRLVVTDAAIESENTKAASDPPVVTLNWNSPIVFYQGWRIKLPRQYANRQYYRTVTHDQLVYWCIDDADMVVSIPLSIVAFAGSKKYVNAYNIQGAWLQDPSPTWAKRQAEATQKFQALNPNRSMNTPK